MIKVNALTIKEMRGIRDLTLHFNYESFVVSGSNGTGKSGVVDAIEFGLTGQITRLEGVGTGSVSLKSHGPHISQRTKPQFSEVTLDLTFTESGVNVTLTRNMKSPKTYSVSPDNETVRAALDEVANHPELVLSRREIIKFIIARPGDRSELVQSLLRLDGIDETRKLFKSAENKLGTDSDSADADVLKKTGDLTRHLEIDSATKPLIVDAVNAKRKVLGLPEIATIDSETLLLQGLETAEGVDSFDKASALRDIEAASTEALALSSSADDVCQLILNDLQVIKENPGFLNLIERSDFVSRGLELVTSASCPLCDTEWEDIEELKSHIQEKINESHDAVEMRDRLLRNGETIAKIARKLVVEVVALNALATKMKSEAESQILADWNAGLGTLVSLCTTLDGLMSLQSRLADDWSGLPSRLSESIEILMSTVRSMPDQSASVSAASYLGIAQERFSAYATAVQSAKDLKRAHLASSVAYQTYCSASEDLLENLYQRVETDFSNFYKILNGEDEATFKAEFRQEGGKLDLEVDFYGNGLFPPHAYHSEGHQDGMGVCLYLALMKQVLPNEFLFSVLDDVVMSIDVGHRKRFCRLLLDEFPNTQFIITTHDRVWAKQMRTAGLIGPRAGVEFTGWSVDTGPIFEEIDDVWTKIDADLVVNDVNAAGARLRHYLEYVCSELADDLGASVKYRADSDYDLGDLWSGVTSRYNKLLSDAAKSAVAWAREDLKALVEVRKDAWTSANKHYGEEGWILNRVVHYNDWATFSQDEFREVVVAAKGVLTQLRCDRFECNSWLFVTPYRGDAENLRCRCGAITLNLRLK